MLNAACAGDQTEPLLRLTEDRGLSRGKAHVTGQHELAAGAAHASLDLRDGHEPAATQITKQRHNGCLAGQLGGLFSILADPRHVDVRDEVVPIGAREYEYLT